MWEEKLHVEFANGQLWIIYRERLAAPVDLA